MTRRFKHKFKAYFMWKYGPDYEDAMWQEKYAHVSNPPCTELRDTTQVVFIGLPAYGVRLHEKRTFWSMGLLRELHSTLGTRPGQRAKRCDLRKWKTNGIQLFKMDAWNTYCLLCDIKYKISKKRKMCVILVGKEVQKYYPAIKDHDENVLLMRLTIPSTHKLNNTVHLEQFNGSGVFKKCADFLGWPLDKFKV